MPIPDSDVEQVVPERRRRIVILLICSMALLVVGLDATIVNVALPSIRGSLHSSLSGLQWTIDAYTLVLASLLMLSGSTADRFGRRRVFQCGLALFSLGSLLCALAPSLDMLIAARVLQAIGGSMLNPVAMSIIRNVFVDARERAMAIGVWGAVFGVSMALGPVLGGVLVQISSWRAVFLVNLPVGAIAIVLTALFVPESKADHARRVDPVGQVLVIAALATLTYGIIDAPRAGWTSPSTLILFGCSIACFAALVLYELRRREPLVEIRFFRSVPFAGASITAVGVFAAVGGFLFLNTLYLQEARGLSPLDAGLYTLPMAGAMLVASPLSGRILGNHGTRLPLVIGSISLIASGLLLTTITSTTSDLLLFVAYLLFGVGTGMINPPITNTAVTGMPPSQAGVAAAVASTSRQVGATLGVAVLGALAGGDMIQQLGPSFATATHTSWWVVVGIGCVMLVGAFVTTTPWALRTATETAERLRERDRPPTRDGQATESAPAHAVV
jgi:EmrB/QacA subfamily drug resistance transporter